MSRLLAVILVSVVSIAPIAATAGPFGLPNIPNIPGLGSKFGEAGDLTGAQDQLVKQYVDANKTVLLANAHLADAMGLKDDAAQMRASGESLGEGATKGNLADADKATSATNQKLAEKLNDKTTVLDADSKRKYTEGLITMASGMVKYVGMRSALQTFAGNLRSASLLMLPRLQSGVYIVSSLPTNVKNLSSALNNAIGFAQSHDIEVPKDVTAALNGAF